MWKLFALLLCFSFFANKKLRSEVEKTEYMNAYICVTCGVQYAPTKEPPDHCVICEDERQYVNANGQQWIQVNALASHHTNQFQEMEPHLFSIKSVPKFAIGQRAFLIQSKGGNILWDCLSLVDQASIDLIRSLGGISAIVISHPHFYGAMVEWSHAFGNVPIYIHDEDRKYVMRSDPSIVFWKGASHQLQEGLTIIHCGGHFSGSSVLHWADGADGRGVLLTGDTILVTPDTRYVSFMYSFPNLVPLGSKEILNILKAIQLVEYDRIYTGFEPFCKQDAKQTIANSAARYLSHIENR